MKVLALIILVVIGFVSANSDEELLDRWEMYKQEFGKSYRSPVEARRRLAIFKENLEKIEQHNALFAQGKTTHTEGINQFTDWSEEEFLQYVNKGLIDRPIMAGAIYNVTENVENLASIDWRTAGVVTPVKNQLQCGSCWSFSATGSIEGQLGRRGRLVSLSEQNLIDCSGNYGNKGCGGGLMNAAFNYVRDHGIESEQDYPYSASNGYCRANPSRVITRISTYYSILAGNENMLRTAIASVGPISVAIDATANLQRYSRGIFRDLSCSSQALNHGVLAVGYGTENGINYYIIKNSWGAAWGEAGYFRLEMKNNQCGIATMASYPALVTRKDVFNQKIVKAERIAKMKVFALICIVVIGCVAAISDEEVLDKWQNYQVKYGKSYRSPVESRKRLAIFKENLEKIEKHNALYDQGKTMHTEGINQFTDWTKEEFLQYVNKGLINKPVIVGEVFNKSENFANVGSIDWRSAGVVTEVKNQGGCGSCWSFSATGAIEGQLGRNGYLISLSEQNLIDCSSGYGNLGCNGGMMTAAFGYVRDNGIVSEQDYPYEESVGLCRPDPSRIITRISTYYTIPYGDEQSLQQALATVGPISVAIDATETLQSYGGGILRDNTCSSQALNHGVLLVGSGVENGIEYYIVKNSWGPNWGEGGYFRLQKINNQCGIASMASYPVL
ncbi:uncharacterized protein LOC123316744 [Coccinella septempunctata]|uniref:uncharacterized protein LOC123316744 n=1 Tax=Coccinella septempunctata TaxID=41139 RepID=UPI001D08A5C0|nr:uncharacterized protein LOC123316744 [Coccinella septempunctata]